MSRLNSSWKLRLVARLDAFHACLADADCDSVRCALSSKAVETDFELQEATDGAGGGTPDRHLDRYKRWKLGDAKIEELTSVRSEVDTSDSAAHAEQTTTAIDVVEAYVSDLSFFARGKRGVLFAGHSRTTGNQVVVKFAGDPRASTSSTAAGCWVETEAKWIRTMNAVGIGARLERFGTGWLVCERLEGQNIVEFLTTNATHATARWALREILLQCFTMDMMGINKEEMTHPTRHIIIHSVSQSPSRPHRRWKCTFIDFEKCSLTKKPKNVTQVCQFISSPRMTALLGAKGVAWDVQALRQHTKRYKLRVSSDTFGELLRVFNL